MSALVIFLGSRIAGDDTAGYEIFMKLKNKLDARTEYLGTDLFKLYGVYENEEKLIIVDAVYGIDDVIYLKDEEIFKINDKSSSVHFLAAIEALKILKIVMEKFPKEIHLIGLPAKSFEEVTYSEKEIEKAIEKIREIIG